MYYCFYSLVYVYMSYYLYISYSHHSTLLLHALLAAPPHNVRRELCDDRKWFTYLLVKVKSSPSHVAHGTALISVSVALSHTPAHCETTSASRGVYVCSPSVRPVADYTAWWQRHWGVSNLPKVTTQCYDMRYINSRFTLLYLPGRDSNRWSHMLYRVSHAIAASLLTYLLT